MTKMMSEKGERKLRTRLEGLLGEPLKDAMWALLKDENHVRPVLDGEEEVGTLLATARRYLAAARDLPPPRKRGLRGVDSLQSSPTQAYEALARSRAIAALLIPYADAHDGVRAFRSARLRAKRGKVQLLFLPDVPAWLSKQSITVLGALKKLKASLAKDFLWSEEQAEAFVLAGAVPEYIPVRFDVESRKPAVLTRIRLEIDPAVPPEALMEIYRVVRREVIVRRPRMLGLNTIALAQFAAELKIFGHDLKGMTLLEEWNRQVPGNTRQLPGNTREWRYEPSEIRNFSRDVAAAQRRLLEPEYRTDGGVS
jgi:hypothetical protein